MKVNYEKDSSSEEKMNYMPTIRIGNSGHPRIQGLNSAFGNQIEMLDTLLAGWSRNAQVEYGRDKDEDSNLDPWRSCM